MQAVLAFAIARGEKVAFDETTREYMIVTGCHDAGLSTPCGVPVSQLQSLSKEQVQAFVDQQVAVISAALANPSTWSKFTDTASASQQFAEALYCVMAWGLANGDVGPLRQFMRSQEAKPYMAVIDTIAGFTGFGSILVAAKNLALAETPEEYADAMLGITGLMRGLVGVAWRNGRRISEEETCTGSACRAPGQCFVAGTLVWTSSGPKAIERVRVGELVLTRDERTGATLIKPVTKTFKRQSNKLLHLTLQDPKGGIETIVTTPEHPFHVPGRGFTKAGDLKPYMFVSTARGTDAALPTASRGAQTPWLRVSSRNNDPSGALLVKSVTLEDRDSEVYNFEVADTHTYFVGESIAWVHNDCTRDSSGRPVRWENDVDPTNIGTGTATNQAARDYARGLGNATDDAGHALGRLLGGSGTSLDNIFPQNLSINRGEFRAFERLIADNVATTGQSVRVVLEAQYAGGATRPSSLTYTATFANGQVLQRSFSNP